MKMENHQFTKQHKCVGGGVWWLGEVGGVGAAVGS